MSYQLQVQANNAAICGRKDGVCMISFFIIQLHGSCWHVTIRDSYKLDIPRDWRDLFLMSDWPPDDDGCGERVVESCDDIVSCSK